MSGPYQKEKTTRRGTQVGVLRIVSEGRNVVACQCCMVVALLRDAISNRVVVCVAWLLRCCVRMVASQWKKVVAWLLRCCMERI